jgi:hypothetical protein
MQVFGPGTRTGLLLRTNDLLLSYTDSDYRREELRYLNHNERTHQLQRQIRKADSGYSLRFGYQTAVCNAHHSVEQRMCRWLLISADRLEASKIRLSQALLAYMLGTRRQSVGAVAVKLQDQALLSYRRTNIEIADRLELEKRSCECYQALRQPAAIITSPGPASEIFSHYAHLFASATVYGTYSTETTFRRSRRNRGSR